MTRDDIIRMFNEAGESAGWRPGLGNALVINYLTHFADLVAVADRERIAALVEQMGIDGYGTLAIAAAIRKGGHP
jgi:hypothetical protein